ncbi:DUF222 domain-containing protein [Mycolicibacterium phlei]
MGFERLSDRLAVAEDAVAALVAEPLDGLSTEELLAFTAGWERHVRASAMVGHRCVAQLGRVPVAELGEPTVAKTLVTLLRISSGEARRRVKDAAVLVERTTISGESLAPVWQRAAAMVRRGLLGAGHVAVLHKFFDHQCPRSAPCDVREEAEHQLAELGATLDASQLGKAAERLGQYLDQDGQFTEPVEQKCWLRLGRQRSDGTSTISGVISARMRAFLEAGLAIYDRPGRNTADSVEPIPAPGPDLNQQSTDEPAEPAVTDDPEATESEALDLDLDVEPEPEPEPEVEIVDTRSAGQRRHDAVMAMLRDLLALRPRGVINGFPATVVITATLQDLTAAAGTAITAGGTLLSMRELIAMAAQAHPYLAVFDKHSNEPLYLGRAKRCASTSQRLMLFAMERGCTKPGCTVPAYYTQAHHAVADWAVDGQTNITDLTLACGPDNRAVRPGGYRTRKRADGRTEWLPPPQLDTGQARVNNYHHPERYLIPDDHTDTSGDGDGDDCSNPPGDNDRDAS